MKHAKETVSNRRDFLKLAALSAPAAVAAAASVVQPAAAATTNETAGMRDTAHTRAYYDSARF